MKKVIIFLLLITCAQLFAESGIELPAKRSPLKAGVLSALIPGGGQFYNHSYLKGGTVLIIEGLLLGYAIKNHQQADKYYKDWQDTESPIAYANYKDYYEKRDNDIWWLGITIFLSTMDAVTDAYLYDFDYQKSKVHLKFKDTAILLEYKF
ncbi:MAG: hypothetical protein K9N06_08100 [Candidatus Cloacimonetes bacterium]|nr:hypothetical protein [Candidatus Cloacimonadota bacterium]